MIREQTLQRLNERVAAGVFAYCRENCHDLDSERHAAHVEKIIDRHVERYNNEIAKARQLVESQAETIKTLTKISSQLNQQLKRIGQEQKKCERSLCCVASALSPESQTDKTK